MGSPAGALGARACAVGGPLAEPGRVSLYFAASLARPPIKRKAPTTARPGPLRALFAKGRTHESRHGNSIRRSMMGRTT